jgi:hypothetical protein
VKRKSPRLGRNHRGWMWVATLDEEETTATKEGASGASAVWGESLIGTLARYTVCRDSAREAVTILQ